MKTFSVELTITGSCLPSGWRITEEDLKYYIEHMFEGGVFNSSDCVVTVDHIEEE